MHELLVDSCGRQWVEHYALIRCLCILDTPEGVIGVTKQLVVNRGKCLTILVFEQVDDLLLFTLVGQQTGKPGAGDMLGCLVSRIGKQLIEYVNRILIAILVHIQACHRKFRLSRITRIGIFHAELAGNNLRLFEAAGNNMLRKRLVHCRTFELRLELAILIIIVAGEYRDTETKTANHVAAILRPPRANLFNLFFFRK